MITNHFIRFEGREKFQPATRETFKTIITTASKKGIPFHLGRSCNERGEPVKHLRFYHVEGALT